MTTFDCIALAVLCVGPLAIALLIAWAAVSGLARLYDDLADYD
jgi:hypothetical protein